MLINFSDFNDITRYVNHIIKLIAKCSNINKWMLEYFNNFPLSLLILDTCM